MNFLSTKWLLVAAAALAMAPTTQAFAAGDLIFNNIENESGEFSDIHAGAETGLEVSTNNSVRVLVGIQFHGIQEDAKPGHAWRLFWINGSIATDPTGKSNSTIADYDLKITPFTYLSNPDFARTGEPSYEFKFGTVNKFNNTDMKTSGFIIRAFDAGLNFGESTADRGGFFVKWAVNALGYSMAEKLSVKNHGVYLAGLNLTQGGEFMLNKALGVPKNIRFRASVTIDLEMATTDVRADMYGQAAIVSKGKYSESSFFVKTGGQVYSFYGGPDSNPVYKDVTAGFVMTGVNISW